MEKLAHSGADFDWTDCPIIRFLLLLGKEKVYDGVRINRIWQNRGPIESDRLTVQISPQPVLRLCRLLHPRTSSGTIPRNQNWAGTNHSSGNGMS